MKWKAYWTTLAALMLGMSLFRNRRKYPDKPLWWVALKATADCGTVGILAWILPTLLISFCVLWICSHVKADPVWKMIAGILTALSLTALSGWCLEFVLLLGLWSIDAVTGRFVRRWRVENYLLRKAA